MDLLDADAPGSSARAAFASASTGAASRARPPRAALRPLVLHEFGHKRGLEVHVSGFKWLAVTFHELGLLDDTAAMRAELGLLATRIAQDRAEKQATSSQSYAASQMLAGAQLVTSDTLIDAWRALQEAAQRSAHADSRDTDDLDVDAHIRVVSSFALPRYAFDVRRRTFVRPSGGPPSILARAASRPASVRERLEIMRAVVARDDHFQAPLALGASTDKGPSEFLSLSTTTDLAGRAAPASCLDGEGARNFLLLGLLTTLPDGRAAVEDLDGVVPLDLSQAQEGEGLFTHGAIVLLEGFARALPRSAGTGGVGNSGVVFVATQIGHPPAERREKSLKLYGHIDFLGTGVLGSVDRERLRAHERAVQDAAMARGEDPDAAGLFMVTMSDVRLDSDRDLAKLATVFEGFEYSSFIPRIIVLCGHFCSDTTTGDRLGRYKAAFARLASLLRHTPQILATSHIVLVPGPDDVHRTNLLPRPPLPPSVTQSLHDALPAGHLHSTSNPARIRVLDHDIVVFRYDTARKMVRNTVLVKDPSATDPDDALGAKPGFDAPSDERRMHRWLVSSLCDQAYLSPLPAHVQPVLWEHDHALRLFPLPDALILADRSARFTVKYEGCRVFNPGPFAGAEYAWATYYLPTRTVESSFLPPDEEVHD